MATLKLYGVSTATCTRRVATVLHELKVPFELVEVPYKNGEIKTPEFLKFQPFGQVPYLDDNGFILYESRAICRYVAAKYASSALLPTEHQANALFEQAASIEFANFEPSASKAGLQLYMSKQGQPCDENVVKEQLAVLEKKLEAYELILSRQRYLAGETLTLADLFHLPYAAYVTYGGSDIMTRRPNVARWFNELISRPAWLAYQDGVKTTTVY
ncbi:thioredoxin-like protein [Favolaschia claudopus]|uniref:glutathione transferase n=1 Tax=Favolaschia claudopus TaxID=2862362 RepID=A0AAW0DZF9_9AGAR